MGDHQCLWYCQYEEMLCWGILTSQHVPLQMLRMEVCFGAIGARKLAVGIFLWNGIALGRTIEAVLHNGRTSWRTW